MNSLYLFFLAQSATDRWKLEIGDPTFIGWFTAVSYFAVAYLCYRNANALSKRGRFDRVSAIWWILAFVLVFLGINKQLDLQSLMIDIGRRMAVEHKWYANRRALQKILIIAITIGGIAMLSAGVWIVRKHLRSLRIVFIGMTILMTFVVLRAAYFNHIERYVGHRMAGLKTIWILELSGLALIGWGAFRQKR